jgi:bifunctional UDP-N-acetylglucosamine pyrophosphorylase/glucosamine-1-phosphate N-acetyltransferase
VNFQALILAAGKGTRMKSSLAKVLHRANGWPLLEYVLHALTPLGADPITVVTGHQAERVEAAFENRGLNFVRQEPQLGTGHAVQTARRVIKQHGDRQLLVLGGDTPLLQSATISRLIDAHLEACPAATLLSCRLDPPGAYGRIVRDARGNVLKIVEAKDAKSAELALCEINAGVYAFDIPRLLAVLDRLSSANAQGELYLTDVIGLLAQTGQHVQAVIATDPDEILGVNTMEELAVASKKLRSARLGALMRGGVIVEDPDSTMITPEVVVEPGAILRPFTVLEGRTIVRTRASIGPFARLIDCQVGEDAEILDHCLLCDTAVDASAIIGPHAHIRSGRLAAGLR